jgi:MFS transporter, FHS family, glucose/mannose:H+ symporter
LRAAIYNWGSKFTQHNLRGSPLPDSTPTKGTVFAHLDFVLVGMVMTVLGPILPSLSLRWGLNDMQAGYLFFAQFGSSCLGMLVSGTLVRRYGYRLTMMFGLAMSGVGVALLARADWGFGLLAVCIFGVAFGTNTPATNLLVARSYAPNSAPALNLLNSSWGVGAMGCPLLVALALRVHRVPVFLYALAGALILLVVLMAGFSFRVDKHQKPAAEMSATRSNPWKHHLLPIIAMLFFVYVGSENSVGGWVASYAHRITVDSSTFWTITPSFFWGALLLGRALAPLALRRVHETKLAGVGVALAAIGVSVLLLSKTMAPVVAGASLAGLGFSSVYPINVSLLSHWFGETTTRVSGVVFALGNLGGAVLPWIVGFLSTRMGSLRAGLSVPLCGALGMLVFYLVHKSKSS